jgi:Fur family ferric uptake transcriptional regulator
MQKEMIVEKLRERGYRMTKQRHILLDIILNEECSCCKEIYYKAVKKDKSIGAATVYRMVNTLEEIGAIGRSGMYQVLCDEECGCEHVCSLEFEDGTVLELSIAQWSKVVKAGLEACGYAQDKKLQRIHATSCTCVGCNGKCLSAVSETH